MTIYTVISPHSQCLGWHNTKKDAWKKAKKVYKKSRGIETKVKKKELKAVGYKLDTYTGNENGSADEQMMLQGR